MSYDLDDLEQFRLEMEDETDLEWEVFEIGRWWKDETELTRFQHKAQIDDIDIHLATNRRSDHQGEPIDEWGGWWTYLERPTYCCIHTGGEGDTHREAWENLQPRLTQWISRPWEVERQLS